MGLSVKEEGCTLGNSEEATLHLSLPRSPVSAPSSIWQGYQHLVWPLCHWSVKPACHRAYQHLVLHYRSSLTLCTSFLFKLFELSDSLFVLELLAPPAERKQNIQTVYAMTASIHKIYTAFALCWWWSGERVNPISLICFSHSRELTCDSWTFLGFQFWWLNEDEQFCFTFSPGRSCRNKLGKNKNPKMFITQWEHEKESSSQSCWDEGSPSGLCLVCLARQVYPASTNQTLHHTSSCYITEHHY